MWLLDIMGTDDFLPFSNHAPRGQHMASCLDTNMNILICEARFSFFLIIFIFL